MILVYVDNHLDNVSKRENRKNITSLKTVGNNEIKTERLM